MYVLGYKDRKLKCYFYLARDPYNNLCTCRDCNFAIKFNDYDGIQLKYSKFYFEGKIFNFYKI